MKNFYKLRCQLAIILLFIIVSITGCQTQNNRYADLDPEKITIIATLFPQYDFARQIAGDYANIILLIPPGMESHSYDPSPADIVAISNADVFLYTGPFMEGWAEKIIEGIDAQNVLVTDVSRNVPLVKEEDIEKEHELSHVEHSEHMHREGEHIYDPHIWTNPVYAQIMVENILDALIQADIKHEDIYKENAQNYKRELEKLDQAFRDTVREGNRKELFIGGRFAMYYFTKEYGLTYEAAFDSCSSETEPNAKAVAHIIDEMRENQIPVIYYEELTDPKIARTISEDTNSQMLLLHSCHNISKEEFLNGVTYLDLMWRNVENLRIGLQ